METKVKKANAQELNSQDDGFSQIEITLRNISEESLLETYRKYASSINWPGITLPKKKKDLSFYLSVYYKDKIVRSRTISALTVENNKEDKILKEKHEAFFNENYTSHSLVLTDDRNNIFYLKIGYVTFIISNGTIEAAGLFCFILAANFTLLKAAALIKETGSFNQLIKLNFLTFESSFLYRNYLEEVRNVFLGKRGEHL